MIINVLRSHLSPPPPPDFYKNPSDSTIRQAHQGLKSPQIRSILAGDSAGSSLYASIFARAAVFDCTVGNDKWRDTK